MPDTAPPAASSLGTVASFVGLAASLWLGYGALSQAPQAPASDAGLGAAPELEACRMERDGFWTGRIFGARRLDLDWRGAALDCAGNSRPDGRGLRLFFAGRPGTGTDRLLLVLGFGAGIDNLAGGEHAVSVTLVDEATSEFFHSPGDRCFAEISEVSPLPGRPGSYRIEGDLYCAGAIASVTGPASVTLGDMAFAGRLTLDAG